MTDFWPAGGFAKLGRDDRGWLLVTDEWLRLLLARPELAPVEDSCDAELALHRRLESEPSRVVPPADVDALRDSDARDSYRFFLRFRDALLAAGTLEGWYLELVRRGTVDVPPLFIDLVVQEIASGLVAGMSDAYEDRASDMLFRSQRVTTGEGQVLAGDSALLDAYRDTAGLGAMGLLLVEAGAPMRTVEMEVLGDANQQRYWNSRDRHAWLIDLGQEKTAHIGYDLWHARSGLRALARVLERWVTHFLGIAVTIRPLQKIEDEAWRWHVGLDVESTAILNDLYEGRDVEAARLQRLISLFRLDFTEPGDMRADVAGKPVYLGVAMNAQRLMKLKPQNLLLNLPVLRIS
jgi:Family of unknown function (DUF6352)